MSVNEQEGFVLCSHSSSVSSLSLLGGWLRGGKLRDGRFCDDCRSALRACPVAGQSYGEAPVPYWVPVLCHIAESRGVWKEFYLIYKCRWGAFGEFSSQKLCSRPLCGVDNNTVSR